jgi:hypothetical protein
MEQQQLKLAKLARMPGGTVLGGAACGFSYEGARHDALAREDAVWKREVAAQDPAGQQTEPRKPKADPSN